MRLYCKRCHYTFESTEDNYECAACGFDMRPYVTGKVRITKSKIRNLLFWVVYFCIIAVLDWNVEISESDAWFPIIIIITVFVSIFKKLIERGKNRYREVMGERMNRSEFTDINISGDSTTVTYGIVHKFYVDGKEYRCVSGPVSRITYHLFTRKKAKIMYNVNDPRDNYDKSGASYKAFLFTAFILLILLFFMSIF